MPAALLAHINKFTPLTEEEEAIVLSYVKHRLIGKKEYLFKEGQVCPANYFIIKGCIRMYYINNKGVEHVMQFGIDNWWITDYTSLDRRSPSLFFLQAVEQCEVMVLEHSIQEELLARVPKMERYFRIITQRVYGAFQFRLKYMADMSAEERYHDFVRQFPGFVQRIPQYMLASYLGFTPEFLSKIRAAKV